MSLEDPPVKRTRNASRTSAEILTAAVTAFSNDGYAQAGIREIAAAARCNPALIRRYFGSKEDMFRAAMAASLDVEDLIAEGHAGFGDNVAAILCGKANRESSPTSMMVLATADPGAKSIVEDLLKERIIGPLSEWLGPPQAELRAAAITVLCTGFTIYRDILPLPSLAGLNEAFATAWLSQALQAIVDGAGFADPPPTKAQAAAPRRRPSRR